MTFRLPAFSPEWDDEAADGLEGAVVLVGPTFAEPAGERVEQFHGVVVEAVRDKGVRLSLRDSREGETFWVPPDLSQLRWAVPSPAARDGGHSGGP